MPHFTFNPNDLHRLNRMKFSARGARTESSAGTHQNRRSGEGTDFLDYRSYVPGDDVRNVDWNVFGRLRQIFVRVHESAQQLAVTLVVDCSRSMLFGQPLTKLEQAQRLACALGFVALRGGDRLYAVGFNNAAGLFTGPLTTARALGRLVRFLQDLPAGGLSNLMAAVEQLRRRRRQRGLLIVISDFLNVPDCQRAIGSLLAGGGRLLAIQVLDPLDRGVGLKGTMRLRDSETGLMVDVKVDSSALAAYQTAFELRRQKLEGYCHARGQQYIRAATTDHYLDVACDAIRAKAVLT
jgi:uncharacterized protein (DUF58 family)